VNSKPDPKIGIGGAPTRATILPTDAAGRKDYPMATGCLFYFPDALAEVSNLSKRGNDQHNPGQPLHWARGKSGDEADTLVRHLAQSGTRDVDGVRHSTKVAWRALAALQKEIEQEQKDTREAATADRGGEPIAEKIALVKDLMDKAIVEHNRMFEEAVEQAARKDISHLYDKITGEPVLPTVGAIQPNPEDLPSEAVSDGQQHTGYVCPMGRKMGTQQRVEKVIATPPARHYWYDACRLTAEGAAFFANSGQFPPGAGGFLPAQERGLTPDDRYMS
jgi:hypothetical protein